MSEEVVRRVFCKKWFLAVVFLGMAVLLVFFPLFSAGYIILDDPAHFFGNPLISHAGAKTTQAIFFTPHSALDIYIPFTLWSFYLESLLFKFNPLASHAINIVLHFLTALLVMFLGGRLGLSLKGAFAGALLFAVHPMHVESVAWVTERKDVLYGAFYVAALVLYCDYLDDKKGRKYILALICAGLSILAKPMALSLPIVLFLIDIFKGRKISWGMFIDKAPFFLAVVPVAFVTYLMQARHIELFNPLAPLTVLWCFVFYIEKFFFPVGLSFTYSMPLPVEVFQPAYLKAMAFFFLIALLVLFFRRNRWVLFAFLFYVMSTFFLWRVDKHELQFVADRFMYLPSVGFCLLAGYAGQEFLKRPRVNKTVVVVAGIILCAILGLISAQKANEWKNTLTLTTAMMRDGGDRAWVLRNQTSCLNASWCAEPFCADVKKKYSLRWKGEKAGPEGSCDNKTMIVAQIQAKKKFLRIISKDPLNAYAFLFVGDVYFQWHNFDKAIIFLKRAWALDSQGDKAAYELGVCYKEKKEWVLAMKYSNAAILADPMDAYAYSVRARVAIELGDKKKAAEDSFRLIELKPMDPYAYDYAVDMFKMMGDHRTAQRIYQLKKDM